jgi:hypothetical protein
MGYTTQSLGTGGAAVATRARGTVVGEERWEAQGRSQGLRARGTGARIPFELSTTPALECWDLAVLTRSRALERKSAAL